MSRVLGVLLILLGTATTAAAHDGPEHVIEAIDAEIARGGPTAELLYRRACEYRALRRYDRAETDLSDALRLDADFVTARFEMARILVRRGESARAFKLIAPLVLDKEESLQAAAIALRGELHLARGDAEQAAADFTTALAYRPEVEWFLLRGEAQHAAGRDDAWIDGLREGSRQTASPVVEQALCDALIALGGRHLPEAGSIVARELADGRYHSAWLLRRARILLAVGDRTAAEADLRTAIAELQTRLNPQRPDPTLVAERVSICRLLGIAPPATAVDAEE